MKNIGLIIIIQFWSIYTYPQDLKGRFEGAVSRDGSIQLVNLNFYSENNIQKGTYEIPEVGSFDVPINDIKMVNDTLHVRFYYGNFFCFVSEDKKEITGISEKWNPKLRLHLKKAQSKEHPYNRKDITFKNGNVQLSGMLYTPRKGFKGQEKYVVLVHGSGVQDRYSPYYISLGHSLSREGIGVLLYDKRGTGKSSGNFETASIQDLANDAIAAYSYIRNSKKNAEIGFLGTSQGGWISSLAANKITNCDFLILNVGPAVSVFKQDIHRVEYSMKADGWKESDINAAIEYTKLYFKYAKDNKHKTWLQLKSSIAIIKDKEWVEYVNIPENKHDFNWWRNNDYDPQNTLKRLKCRTLSLFGEYDPLVPPKENEKLMRDYLTLAGIKLDIKVIPGTLHDMKTFQGLNGENWNWPKIYWEWRKQPKEFMQSIIKFINN